MNTPELGFYHHYKHSDEKGVSDYAYEVVGIGHHTEVDGLEESAMVIYRPLYETAPVYKLGKHSDLRPVTMFMETGDFKKNGSIMPRFTKITDPEVITELEKQKEKMYS